MAQLKWYGDAIKARIERHSAIRLEVAARGLRDYIRQRLNEKRFVTATVLARHLSRNKGSHAEGMFLNAFASRGTYPMWRTGWLRDNIQMEMDRPALVARVGTSVIYGRYLEFGTSKMLPRPWLSLGVREFGPQIVAILQQPVAK